MPLISNEFIDSLLRDADILSVFQHLGIHIEKKGSSFFCKSPFNEEKTASCHINNKKQTYTDYSSGKYGNAVSLLMDYKGLSYPEAITELAQIQNKTVVYEKAENEKAYQERKSKQAEQRKYLKALAKKFQEELKNLPKTHPAWLEIQKREYTDTDVLEWGIGYAPGHNFMYQLFSQSGAVDIGKKLGLINDKNNDKIWDRLVYPLYNVRNEIIGFASRDLSEFYGKKNSVKWMNPAENDLYNKHRELYGMNTARNAIHKQNKCWILEGYNDVIAWHKIGLENAVGICGTALTESHIREIGKLTKKVVLCLDADEGGIKGLNRSLPLLISQGFSVEICILPDNLDPDDYSRKKVEDIKINGAEKSLSPYISKGFDYLLVEKIKGDELDRANGIKEIVNVISKIPDITLRNLYVDKLTKFSKQKSSVIRALMQEKESEQIRKDNDESTKYQLPKKVTTPIEILEPIIEKYGLFISDDEIFIAGDYDFTGALNFQSISNFSIEILQHMNDESFPTKLLRVKNIHDEERIFDVPANTLNAPQRFKDALTNNGNYQFRGNQADLDRLSAYLYDKMGIGRKVDVLGWNTEGFYCWNNVVTIPGQQPTLIDKNGIFHFDGHTYYVPSANEIYKNNPYKFAQQKRVKLHSATVSMDKYLDQMKKVHREFAVVGMLFAFAAAHQDLIINIAKGFPLMFLYGPPSTGKDELYGCIKKMFGIAKTDFINLENNQSTGKAKLRSFAEFSNMVVHLSEYACNNKEVDPMLKGLWDRGAYKRATMDSKVSTDSVPILCAALVAGNQSPTDDAVLTRCIYGEMTRDQFTMEERQAFQELEDMTTDGITAYMDKVIWHRPLFEEKFAGKFNMYKKILGKRETFKGLQDRILINFSILGATHEVLKETNDIIFPFTTQEMLEVFDVFVGNLKKKLDASNLSNKFWDVFLACISLGTESQRLHLDNQIAIDGQYLYIRWTDVYNRIQTEWFPRFSESCPNKNTLSEHLRQSNAFVEQKKSHRFGSNYNTSAFVFELNKIENRESIEFALNIQREAISFGQTGMSSFNFDSPPATPNSQGQLNETSPSTLPPF